MLLAWRCDLQVIEIRVAESGVREASGWARDTVREGVAGGNKLGMYISGYITGVRGCGMLCRSSGFSSSIGICATVDNLAGEFLPRKELIVQQSGLPTRPGYTPLLRVG